MPEKVCTRCKGSGVERKDRELTVKIPAGIDDGATIRPREQGEAIANGPRGDLYVHTALSHIKNSHAKVI